MSTMKMARRWSSFGTSIFTEMTQLAQQHQAVNLAQGFPDFPGPSEVLEQVAHETLHCHNQYAPAIGEAALRQAVSTLVHDKTGIQYCPNDEVTITTGATEAIYSVVNAFVNPGDRVIVFEPCYDSYAQAIANAGGILVPVRLHSPETPVGLAARGWSIDWSEFAAAVAGGFKLMILNSPHNPTGKIFSRSELEKLCESVRENDAVLMCDEVYEYLVYQNPEQVLSPVQLPGMRDYVVRISSCAKTFGFTGFKVGWVTASAELTRAVRLVHQAVVFCTNPATQRGLATMMSDFSWTKAYLSSLPEVYASKQEFLAENLVRAGFAVQRAQGSYFLMASYESHVQGGAMRDVDFAKLLIQEARVAAIPPSVFYYGSEAPKRLNWLRFAFCKTDLTLEKAAERLLNWTQSNGPRV
ncbi:MAG: aminotransferase class I/II-fold pyridoxal phosphate-dependent enzyme [Betaproteobacteria bacterium]|nr:aminotransferase class I/II-fold pyridoxal phosphate-dependent enzyme [Betaproteobacteria bacterium]